MCGLGDSSTAHLYSSSNEMFIKFHSDGLNLDPSHIGYKLNITKGMPQLKICIELIRYYFLKMNDNEPKLLYKIIDENILVAPKCICENKNGEKKRNGWLCEQNGSFEKMGSCKLDEWCIGPSEELNATVNYEILCIKGYSPFHFSIIYQNIQTDN